MTVHNPALSSLSYSIQMRGSGASSKLVAWAILLYVHLWILEGMLRKLIPWTNEILYFGRDAIAVLAILGALAYGGLRKEHVPGLILVIGVVLWTCLGALVGTNSLGVWVVGVRSYVAPLLFAFLCSMSGNLRLFRNIQTAIVIQLPIQALVVVAQVRSPADSIWNMQTTGEDAHFLNDGIARASGTFSAPAGLFGFILLAVAIALASIVGSNGTKRFVPFIAIIAAIFMGALSGSRGIVVVLALLMCGFLYWVLTNGTFGRFFLVAFIALGSTGLLVFVSAAFPEVLAAFSGRIQDASEHEDTTARLVFTLLGFVEGLQSVVGLGAGNNSQAGIVMGAGGPWIENESLRWVTELGVLGVGLAILRLGVALTFVIKCLFNSTTSSPLRYMMTFALAIVLLQGTITQTPSSQGAFSIMLALYFGCDKSIATVRSAIPSGRGARPSNFLK